MTALWQGKPIDGLSLIDLESAVATVRKTAENYDNKRTQMAKNRLIEGNRHNKMFASSPLPPVNPIFLDLQNTLEAELKKRTGVA